MTIYIKKKTLEKLQELFEFVNTLNLDLKFTMEIGDKTICFLDLQISIVGKKLTTTVYSKPTDSHLYLHAKSCHKKSSIEGIQKGVALRLRRICSSEENYNEKSEEYAKYLVNRGHDLKSVRKCFNDIGNISRANARKKVTSRNEKSLVVFSTSYNPHGPNVNKILRKNIHLLQNNDRLKEIFPEGTLLVANKREKNLQELLMRSDPYNVKADHQTQEPQGYHRCSYVNCDSCKNFVDETTYVTCHATGRKYQIRRETSCSSRNVIYVAYCIKCKKQGVGSTIAWKPRLSNYKSHIKKKKPTCRTVRHFIEDCNDNGFNNLRFILVDQLNNVDGLTTDEIDELLLQKEKFWIRTLITQHHGFNSKHDLNRKKRSEREK